MSAWRHRETQFLANGITVTSSVWGDNGYLELSVATKERGIEAEFKARMSAEEARRIAGHLTAAADAVPLTEEVRNDDSSDR